MARNPPSGRQPPTTAAGAGAAPRLAALCAHLGTETQRRGVGWTGAWGCTRSRAVSPPGPSPAAGAAQMLSPARVMVGGGPIASVPQEQANACVARALERGVREFDTAAAYGESEVRLKHRLRNNDGSCAALVARVADTRVGWLYPPSTL